MSGGGGPPRSVDQRSSALADERGPRKSWGRSWTGPATGIRAPLSLIIVASLCFASPAQAGPWTPNPGHGYAKLWLKYHLGLEYQDGKGNRREYGGGYHEFFLNAYGEVGLFKNFAFWLHAPLVRMFWLGDARTGETTRHLAPGDPTFGLRWGFLKHATYVGAFELGLRVPIAKKEPVQELWVDEGGGKAERIGSLLVGNGVFDVPIRLAFGSSWGDTYVAGSASMTLRTGGYASLAGWSIEGGSSFLERFSWRLRMRGQHTLGDDDAPRIESPSGVQNGTSFVGLAGEMDVRFVGAWVVGLTVEGGLFAVYRQGRGPVFSLYVATSF